MAKIGDVIRSIWGGKEKAALAYLKALLALVRSDLVDFIFGIVAAISAEGISGDEARKEFWRRFRAGWKGEARTSLVNLLMEIAVQFVAKAAAKPAFKAKEPKAK
jgi:hypothetical protein